MTEIIFERKVADDIIVEKAKTALKSGGIIIVPTDTIPGIGCRADDRVAVARLFKLKERPDNLPIPVILADTDDLKRYTIEISPFCEKLADRYWPGALTMVLRSNKKIPVTVGGGLSTLGFRVPDYSLLRRIIREMDTPMALTSANPHSIAPSGMHQKLLSWWKFQVDLIILGRSTAPRPPSAVVDLVSSPPRILREGIIETDELISYLTE